MEKVNKYSIINNFFKDRIIFINNKKYLINPLFSFDLDKNKIIFDCLYKRVIIKFKSLNWLKEALLKSKEKKLYIKTNNYLLKKLKKENILIKYPEDLALSIIKSIHILLKLNLSLSDFQIFSNSYLKKVLHVRHSLFPRYTNKLSKDFNFLYKRKSTRIFKGQRLTLTKINQLLDISYGTIRVDKNKLIHKTIPSAGAFYPLLVYYFDIKNKKLYVYNGKLKFLRDINGGKIYDYIYKLFSKYLLHINWLNATGFIFVFADLKYSIKKYGVRSYYFSLIESGHLLQNINIYCAKEDIGVCELGMPFNETIMKKLFKIKSNFTLHLLTCIVGI